MGKYKAIELSNGAKLFYTKNKLTKTTMVDLSFGCGARVDTIPGLAHFTEHMFFTGTKDKDKKQMTKQYFDFIGSNAYTNGREIRFAANVFTNEFGAYLTTVHEMITKSTFSQKAVDKEIPVVQQEIARGNDDFKRLSWQFNKWNLTQQPYFKNKIVGNEKSVASIKSKDVKKYVADYFLANNLTAFVMSPLPFNKVKNLITKFADGLKKNSKFVRLPVMFYDVVDDKFFAVHNQDIEKSYLFLNFVYDKGYKDRVFNTKFDLVRKMINDFTDGIQKQMRLEKSLVYSCIFAKECCINSSVTTMQTECEKGNINEIIQTAADYLKQKVEQGFTQAELNKAKREWRYSDEVAEPYSGTEMAYLAQLEVHPSVMERKDFGKIVKNTTLEECNQILREVFASPRVSLSVYGNATKADVMPKAEFKKLFKF